MAIKKSNTPNHFAYTNLLFKHSGHSTLNFSMFIQFDLTTRWSQLIRGQSPPSAAVSNSSLDEENKQTASALMSQSVQHETWDGTLPIPTPTRPGMKGSTPGRKGPDSRVLGTARPCGSWSMRNFGNLNRIQLEPNPNNRFRTDWTQIMAPIANEHVFDLGNSKFKEMRHIIWSAF